jgi:hypothetical protein
MKPFIWRTALIFAFLFLTSTAFIAFDVLTKPDALTNPESKVAVGWLSTGLMFLGLGVRGWRAQRKRDASINPPVS